MENRLILAVDDFEPDEAKLFRRLGVEEGTEDGEKLGAVDRVYPYVVTCGTEIEAWSRGIEDFVERYWIDCVKEEYLRAAFSRLKDHLKATRAEKKLAHLSPGSLSAWPLPEQRKLFSLLGNVKAAVGVELTPSCLMLPAKSISGILFPTESNYENCMHCPRRDCPNRRAAFKGEVETGVA